MSYHDPYNAIAIYYSLILVLIINGTTNILCNYNRYTFKSTFRVDPFVGGYIFNHTHIII